MQPDEYRRLNNNLQILNMFNASNSQKPTASRFSPKEQDMPPYSHVEMGEGSFLANHRRSNQARLSSMQQESSKEININLNIHQNFYMNERGGYPQPSNFLQPSSAPRMKLGSSGGDSMMQNRPLMTNSMRRKGSEEAFNFENTDEFPEEMRIDNELTQSADLHDRDPNKSKRRSEMRMVSSEESLSCNIPEEFVDIVHEDSQPEGQHHRTQTLKIRGPSPLRSEHELRQPQMPPAPFSAFKPPYSPVTQLVHRPPMTMKHKNKTSAPMTRFHQVDKGPFPAQDQSLSQISSKVGAGSDSRMNFLSSKRQDSSHQVERPQSKQSKSFSIQNQPQVPSDIIGPIHEPFGRNIGMIQNKKSQRSFANLDDTRELENPRTVQPYRVASRAMSIQPEREEQAGFQTMRVALNEMRDIETSSSFYGEGNQTARVIHNSKEKIEMPTHRRSLAATQHKRGTQTKSVTSRIYRHQQQRGVNRGLLRQMQFVRFALKQSLPSIEQDSLINLSNKSEALTGLADAFQGKVDHISKHILKVDRQFTRQMLQAHNSHPQRRSFMSRSSSIFNHQGSTDKAEVAVQNIQALKKSVGLFNQMELSVHMLKSLKGILNTYQKMKEEHPVPTHPEVPPIHFEQQNSFENKRIVAQIETYRKELSPSPPKKKAPPAVAFASANLNQKIRHVQLNLIPSTPHGRLVRKPSSKGESRRSRQSMSKASTASLNSSMTSSKVIKRKAQKASESAGASDFSAIEALGTESEAPCLMFEKLLFQNLTSENLAEKFVPDYADACKPSPLKYFQDQVESNRFPQEAREDAREVKVSPLKTMALNSFTGDRDSGVSLPGLNSDLHKHFGVLSSDPKVPGFGQDGPTPGAFSPSFPLKKAWGEEKPSKPPSKESKPKNRKKLVLDKKRSPRERQTKKFIPDQQRVQIKDSAFIMKQGQDDPEMDGGGFTEDDDADTLRTNPDLILHELN